MYSDLRDSYTAISLTTCPFETTLGDNAVLRLEFGLKVELHIKIQNTHLN